MLNSQIFFGGNHTPSSLPARERLLTGEKQRQEVIARVSQELKKTQASLREHSLRGSLAEFTALVTSTDHMDFDDLHRLLSLIHLSFSAKKSGYEGWSLGQVATLYLGLLDIMQHNGLFSKDLTAAVKEEIYRSLQQLQICFTHDNEGSSAKEIARCVAELEVGKSFCMQGGWVSHPAGHAMVYRFQKCSANTFNIQLYHAQKGLQHFHGGEDQFGRGRIHPCMVFEDVSWQELFFSEKDGQINPIIFEKLVFLNSIDLNDERSVEKTILPCFFHIRHRLVLSASGHRANLFISTQVSGNCAVKSINCLLLDLIQESTLYKKISLDFRLFSLIAAYQAYLKNSNALANAQARVFVFQLKEAAASFLTILNSNFSKDKVGITEEQYIKAYATVEEINRELAAIEPELIQKGTCEQAIGGNYCKSTETNIDRKARLKFIAILPHVLAPKIPASEILQVNLNPGLGKGAHWSEIDDVILDLKDLVESFAKKNQHQDLIFQVDATLEHLATLKWVSSPPLLDRPLKIQTNVLAVQKLYNHAIDVMSEYSSAAAQNTGMEFLALSYCLANMVDRQKGYEILSNYSVSPSFFINIARQAHLFACQDSKLLEQRADLERFFTQKPDHIFELVKPIQDQWDSQRKTNYEKLFKQYTEKDPMMGEAFQKLKNSDSWKNRVNDHVSHLYFSDLPATEHLQQCFIAAILAYEICAPKKQISFLLGKIKEEPQSPKNLERLDIINKKYGFSAFSDWCSLDTPRSTWGTHSQNPVKPVDFEQEYEKDFSPEMALEKYTRHAQSAHDSSKLVPENALMMNHLSKPQADFPFYISLTEPEVQTAALLQVAETHLEQLRDVKFRCLLLHMFLKNVESEGRMISPFILSFQDPDRIHGFERLVQKGRKSFVNTRDAKECQLSEMLFLVRLYARALNTARTSSAVPYRPSPETCTLIEEHRIFLNERISLINEAEKHQNIGNEKGELELAKLGLLLGMPLHEMACELQVEVLLGMLRVKNNFERSHASCDPTFLRACKKWFFQLGEKWREIFQDVERGSSFGNACLFQLLGKEAPILNWKLDGYCLMAEGQPWVIDLMEPAIKNASGDVSESCKPLLPTSSLKRLFQDQAYSLKIFGEGSALQEIYFTSPKWGAIKLSGQDPHQQIQRYREGKWLTYIPLAHTDGLRLNGALVSDHALWIDLESQKVDLRFCNLETAEQAFQLRSDGHISRNASKLLFYPLIDKDKTRLSSFEDSTQINGWREGGTQSILEFNRFCGAEDRAPLLFKWNSEEGVWVYSQNPTFRIDPQPSAAFSFEVDRQLHLVNREGSKRMVLIPLGAVSSKGYSSHTSIALPEHKQELPLDRQKGSLRYFAYSIAKDGGVIPQTLEGRIYLAHLYLAQKRYAEAGMLIQSISISEHFTEHALQAVYSLLSHAYAVDCSPNAAANALLTYYMAKRVDPFFAFDVGRVSILFEVYQVYLAGLKHVENTLILAPAIERELLNYLINEKKLMEEMVSGSSKEQREHLRKEHAVLGERLDDLISRHVTKKVFSINDRNYKSTKIPIPRGRHYLTINPIYLEDEHFTRLYRQLKQNGSNECLESQGILYELVSSYHTAKLDEREKNEILYLVAQCGSQPDFPDLPDSSNQEVKKKWCNQIGRLHERYRSKFDNIRSEEDNPYTRFIPPIRKEGVSHQSLPESKSEAGHVFDIPPDLLDKGQDVVFKEWQEQFLCKNDVRLNPTHRPESKQAKDGTSDTFYALSIRRHKEHYLHDCEAASVQQHDKRIFRPDLKDQDYAALINEMTRACEKAIQNENVLKQQIHLFAQRLPTDRFFAFAQARAMEIGEKRKAHTLETILRAAVQSDAIRALLRLNSHLSLDEANRLRSMCIELMIETTHRRHLERIYQPLQKWLKDKSDATSFEQAQMYMIEHRQYDPTQFFFPLFFEYLSDLRIRGKQASILNDLISTILNRKSDKLSSRAFQLIMAGGKTSVIISMLAELIAQSGSVACILSHHSQFVSVKGNLAAFQLRRFNKDLYVLDYSIQDLSKSEILSLILKRMQEAKARKCSILMKTTFPQLLQLKFLLESMRLSAIAIADEAKLCKQRIELLRKINLFFQESCVSIYDECDLNLSVLTDLLIPLGEPQPIQPERAAVVKAIYENILLLAPHIGWSHNGQVEISSQDFESIKVKIARAMAAHPSFLLSENKDWEQAFIRYATNQISAENQTVADRIFQGAQIDLSCKSPEEKANVNFLVELERRYSSSNRYEKESCQLIALTRQMISKVLKIAFSRSYNRRYGRDPELNDGRVVPFLAVATPATTKFSNIYLALAYQFQSALNAPISKGEIQFLAQKMLAAAIFYASKEDLNLLETAEAKQFQELTSVKLSDADSEEGLQQAYKWVNDPKHLKRRLDIEAEVAPFHVSSYPQKISSNAVNNVHQFSQSIACSATLWNSSTYHPNLTTKLDEGTEGAILNRMVSRSKEYADEGLGYIHEMPNVQLESLIRLFKQQPQKSRVRALLDAGGMLIGDYTNQTLALALKQFFLQEKKGGETEIHAIMYLHTCSAEEIEQGAPAESFALLKIEGDDQPVLIRNTTPDEIEAHGLKKEGLFVIFDELRATGTDIALANDAIFLMTCDPGMPLRTAVQGALRARNYFLEQQVEFVVTAEGRKKMVNGGKTFFDLRQTWEINEAIVLKDQVDRAKPEQILNLGRDSLIQDLLKMGPFHADFQKRVSEYEKFLCATTGDDLYRQEKIQGIEAATTVLQEFAANMLDHFPRCTQENVGKQVAELQAHFKATISSAEQMIRGANQDTETEIQQERVEEMDLELNAVQQNEMELSMELMKELESYHFAPGNLAAKEESWKLQANRPLWPQLKNAILCVPKVLARVHFENHAVSEKVVAYAAGFPAHFHMTKNFYQTTVEDLPLLHKSAKDLKFLLYLKDGEGAEQFVFLSQKDAAFFKCWLRQNDIAEEVCLMGLGGLPEAYSRKVERACMSSESILKGLCYANLFNGNYTFLADHRSISKQLFRAHLPALSQYIQMKVLSSRGKEFLPLLWTSDIFSFSKEALPKTIPGGISFSSRRRVIEKKYHEIRHLGYDSVSRLDPDDVLDIAPEQVRWLIKRAQIENLPEKLFNCLTVNQIQQGLLPRAKICFLSSPELIQALSDEQDILALEEGQLQYASFQQLEAIKAHVAQKYSRQNNLAEIPAKYLRFIKLSAEQIRQIPCEHVFKIASIYWPIIPGDTLQKFQKSYKMQKEYVAHLSQEQVEVLSPDYVDFLKDEHMCHLKNVAMIRALKKTDKLALLSVESLQLIHPGQMDNLDCDTFARIAQPALLLTLAEDHPWITGKQKAIIADAILNVPVEIMFDNLHKSRWKNISIEKIKAFQAHYSLNKEAVAYFSQEQAEALDLKYIDFLTDEHIGNLTNEQLIRLLQKPEKLALLSDKALQLIQISQLRNLGQAAMQRIAHPALLLTLAEDHPGITDKQKAIIADAILNVPVEIMFDSLHKSRWKNISIEKIKVFQKKHALEKEQVELLSQVQIEVLDPQYVDFFKDEHFGNLANVHLIRAVKNPEKVALFNQMAQLESLEDDQLLMLSAEQLAKMQPGNFTDRLKGVYAKNKSRLTKPQRDWYTKNDLRRRIILIAIGIFAGLAGVFGLASVSLALTTYGLITGGVSLLGLFAYAIYRYKQKKEERT